MTYTTSTGCNHTPWPPTSLERLRDTALEVERVRFAYVAKYGHEPPEEVRPSSFVPGDCAYIVGNVAYVSSDVFLTFSTARRFDAWMDRLEHSS